MTSSELWVFGYGSVIWKHSDIPHTEKVAGFIKGFKRRFWQGSDDHRGTPGAPGRVVSIYSRQEYEAMNVDHCDERQAQKDEDWRVYGMAFKVTNEHRDKVICSLDGREKGGYTAVWLAVYCAQPQDRGEQVVVSRALTYVASSENPNYLGFAPHVEIARQIEQSHGQSGANIEYLHNLYKALVAMGHNDAHISQLYELTIVKD